MRSVLDARSSLDSDRPLESTTNDCLRHVVEQDEDDDAVMSGSGVERDGGTSDVHSAVHLESRRERNKDDECVELSDGDASRSISDTLHRRTLRPHLNITPSSNLPFIDTFNGVVSRRALLKVPT